MFVVPPSAEELKNRLIGRGTETMEVIESRMSRAIEEAEEMGSYDYILVNESVDKAVEDLHNLIQAQHMKSSANKARIIQMKKELHEIAANK